MVTKESRAAASLGTQNSLGDVHEDVGPSVRRGDEAVAFGAAEALADPLVDGPLGGSHRAAGGTQTAAQCGHTPVGTRAHGTAGQALLPPLSAGLGSSCSALTAQALPGASGRDMQAEMMFASAIMHLLPS